MTSKERVTALLNKTIPDKMGLFEHFWGETLGESWLSQGYPKDENPQYHFDYDIVNCGGWFNSEAFPGRSEVVEESAEWKVTRNGNGATLKLWKNKSGTPEHIDFEVTTPEKWAVYREPLLVVNRERFGKVEEIKGHLAKARAANKFSYFGNVFVFELMRGMLGDQNFLPALLLEPDWIKDFCQVYLDFYRKHYEILFREVGKPDGFLLYEDFGYRNGLFCSPDVMKALIMPYEKELVGFLKEHGLPVILHSCGDIRRAVPLIIEAGFDCLQPMEAKAGCNVIELARCYGKRIAYMGNIDVMALSTNNRQRVQAEVVPKLQYLRTNRIPYFFHSDHSIPPNINLSTYQYALSLFHENNRYA